MLRLSRHGLNSSKVATAEDPQSIHICGHVSHVAAHQIFCGEPQPHCQTCDQSSRYNSRTPHFGNYDLRRPAMFWLVKWIEVLVVLTSTSGCLIAVRFKLLQRLHNYTHNLYFTRHASARLHLCASRLKSVEASVFVASKLVRCSWFCHSYDIVASTVLSMQSALCCFKFFQRCTTQAQQHSSSQQKP